jgi:hypothetical protein
MRKAVLRPLIAPSSSPALVRVAAQFSAFPSASILATKVLTFIMWIAAFAVGGSGADGSLSSSLAEPIANVEKVSSLQ